LSCFSHRAIWLCCVTRGSCYQVRHERSIENRMCFNFVIVDYMLFFIFAVLMCVQGALRVSVQDLKVHVDQQSSFNLSLTWVACVANYWLLNWKSQYVLLLGACVFTVLIQLSTKSVLKLMCLCFITFTHIPHVSINLSMS